jgi:hypothetical protein
MTIKTADSKGRIALGKTFANSTVLIERVSSNEFRVIRARVIPEDEAWLWENDKALGIVMRGLRQAKGREFAETPPDLDLDNELAGGLDD